MAQILTKIQVRFLLDEGYLSKKGIKIAKEVLAGKHDKTRRKQ